MATPSINDLLEKIEVHDQYQFEIKLDYPLDRDAAVNSYSVEAFFFLPDNMNVNPATYGSAQFYGDLHNYIRFKSPQIPLRQILATGNEISPLHRLRGYVARLSAGERGDVAELIVYEAKMLACALRAGLGDTAHLIAGMAERAPDLDRRDAERLARTTIAELRAVLAEYRAGDADLLDPGVDRGLLTCYRLVDEFMSLTAEAFAFQLLACPLDDPECREPAISLALEEARYRKGRGYRSLAVPGGDNEEYVYRHGLLKKYTSNILFLRIDRSDARAPVQNVALALAAGIAMLFASVVALWAQRWLVGFSWSLVAVLVLSYMFKDRLKAWAGAGFNRWLDRWAFDHTVHVTDPSRGNRIGHCREKVTYLRPADVPPAVAQIRNLGRTEMLAEREFSEHVIRYHKAVRLLPKQVFGQHRRRTALTDILRFNVRHLLYTMDEPRQSVHVVDERDRTPKTIDAMKSYHLNVVLRFRGDDGGEYLYQKLRVVLSRQGIRRVEQIPLTLAGVGGRPEARPSPPRQPVVTGPELARPPQRRSGQGTTPAA